MIPYNVRFAHRRSMFRSGAKFEDIRLEPHDARHRFLQWDAGSRFAAQRSFALPATPLGSDRTVLCTAFVLVDDEEPPSRASSDA
jgi:hypothetical protein